MSPTHDIFGVPQKFGCCSSTIEERMLQTINSILSAGTFLHSYYHVSDIVGYAMQVMSALRNFIGDYKLCPDKEQLQLLIISSIQIFPKIGTREYCQTKRSKQHGEPYINNINIAAIDKNTQERSKDNENINKTEIATSKENIICRNAFAHEVCARVCLAHNIRPFNSTRKFRCFRPDVALQHPASPDDFAAANAPVIARFIELLDSELAAHPSCKVVYCAQEGGAALADAVALVGAYVMAKEGVGAEEVVGRFGWLRLPAESGAMVVGWWGAVERRGRGAGRSRSLWAGWAAGRRGVRRAFLPAVAGGGPEPVVLSLYSLSYPFLSIAGSRRSFLPSMGQRPQL
jgi:hypothetical protein